MNAADGVSLRWHAGHAPAGHAPAGEESASHAAGQEPAGQELASHRAGGAAAIAEIVLDRPAANERTEYRHGGQARPGLRCLH
jgi:hypothetical protein